MNQSRSDKFIDVFLAVGIVALIILKLLGVIDFSWAVLFSPIWIPMLLAAIFLLLAVTGLIIRGIIDMIKEKKDERN